MEDRVQFGWGAGTQTWFPFTVKMFTHAALLQQADWEILHHIQLFKIKLNLCTSVEWTLRTEVKVKRNIICFNKNWKMKNLRIALEYFELNQMHTPMIYFQSIFKNYRKN